MLDRLFGMGSERREFFYRLFRMLPRPLKQAAIAAACRRTLRRLHSPVTPVRLIFYVTNRCNARCGHCFFAGHINRDVTEELSVSEIERFVRSLDRRIQSLNLTGGEPFLRKDLPAICRAFDRFNRTVLATLPSNGLLPDRIEGALVEISETTRLRLNVQVSLDGLEKLHDMIRGTPGAFDKAVETIHRFKCLKENYLRINNVSVLTVISKANAADLLELMAFVRDELKVFHKFQFVRSARRDTFEIDSSILSDLASPDALCSLPEEAERGRAYEMVRDSLLEREDTLLMRRQILGLRLVRDILANERPALRCLAGLVDGVVYADGSVAMCEMTAPFANLRDFDMDFSSLWRSAAAETRRAQITRCFCTHPCNISTSMSCAPDLLTILSERRDRWLRNLN